MISKVIFVFVIVAVAKSSAAPQHEQPARFPAGVNPALCPGFPICDNALLHGTAPVAWSPPQQQQHQQQQQWHGAQQQWNAPQTQWNAPQPQWHAAQSWNNVAQNPVAWNQWDAPEVHGPSTNDINGPGGDKYPAGVNPNACPNYPYCDNTLSAASPVAHQVAPLPGWNQRQYPAGVSPSSCPNFPYCH